LGNEGFEGPGVIWAADLPGRSYSTYSTKGNSSLIEVKLSFSVDKVLYVQCVYTINGSKMWCSQF